MDARFLTSHELPTLESYARRSRSCGCLIRVVYSNLSISKEYLDLDMSAGKLLDH